MAPPLEYDKEPKAPDKSAATISNEDSKLLHSIVNDQQPNSDHKPTNTAANTEVENNKQVVNLDDGQLRALLDEAMNYKCPKDLEGKSNLFKELLEEVQQDDQQDDQASEAAARGAARGARRGGGGARGRSQLLQSNSLQDLVAALAAEPAPRRARPHAPHPPAPVSARATQGGSLPSGVDTSFLLGEEPSGARGAGYLATVRCVNPPPLAERRVSASDANSPAEIESLHRRSKPVFPMTYTARATLEIGSGAVCSGRAVTTTTASNQVRTRRAPCGPLARAPPVRGPHVRAAPTCGPPERLYAPRARASPGRAERGPPATPVGAEPMKADTGPDRAETPDPNQTKLMSALCPRGDVASEDCAENRSASNVDGEGKDGKPRGPRGDFRKRADETPRRTAAARPPPGLDRGPDSEMWMHGVDLWYEGLATYRDQFYQMQKINRQQEATPHNNIYCNTSPTRSITQTNEKSTKNACPNIDDNNIATGNRIRNPPDRSISNFNKAYAPILSADQIKYVRKKDLKSKSNPDDSLIHSVEENSSDTKKSDISLRVKSEKIGRDILVPSLMSINPRNIRNMTISKTPNLDFNEAHQSTDVKQAACDMAVIKHSNSSNVKDTSVSEDDVMLSKSENHNDNYENHVISDKSMLTDSKEIIENPIKQCPHNSKNPSQLEDYAEMEMIDFSSNKSEPQTDEIELVDIVSEHDRKDNGDSFLQYCANQQKLFQALEDTDDNLSMHSNEVGKCRIKKLPDKDALPERPSQEFELKEISIENICSVKKDSDENEQNIEENNNEKTDKKNEETVISLIKKPHEQTSKDQYILAELPNNSYIFLTLPKRLLVPLHNTDQKPPLPLREVRNNPNAIPDSSEHSTLGTVTSRKKKDKGLGPASEAKKDAFNKNALKVLLFENLKRDVSVKPGTSVAGQEGDSAIPFSCITTPEVVASCNTTSSTPQSAVAVDPKPLQLGSGYRAVASLTGAAPAPPAAPRADPADPADPPDPADPADPADSADEHARQLQVFVPRLGLQPRSVISSSFNGLPLTRPNYGAAAASAPDEYKKSLDENGNAVQGFSSPVSGSSQHKKPRRKKSSKNETVIKSDQIDGYKGDKDLNEVLRFIESDAEHGRGKLGRAKHDDDKAKKRSTERRKDKDKPKRASSLEELSRTKLEDLTEPRARRPAPAAPAPKPERRSWGDDREPFYLRAASPAPPSPSPAPDHDFQTVTKRRKPRRRADEPEPPRRPPPGAPPRARRESAPPSDRSNDSNDDLDSVHSLPPDAPAARAAPAPPPHASYADIARTRHNIPDLIESCNFYAEGDAGALGARRAPGEPPTAPPDDYPALGGRAPRTKPPPRRERKERAPPPPPPDCPAPDVVADRRPPVILLDSAARPRELDGVTFGFDINEQLLSGPARRPRCDLVRDALDAPKPPADATAPAPATPSATAPVSLPPGTTVVPAASAGCAGGVRVRAGCAALRYVPPDPPPDTRHLHQLVDYVGSAWEDVVRCGGGKVRYFSE